MLKNKISSYARPLVLLATGVILQCLADLAMAHDFGGNSSGGGGSSPPPPDPCSAEKPCQCPPPGKSGKPIHYWSGRESFVLNDLVVHGQFPIVIARRYDSQSEYDSVVGYGWAFTYDRALYEYPDDSVILRMGCGVRERFTPSGSSYQGPSGGVLGGLVRKPDGTFEMSFADGSRDYFDAQGRLTAAQNRAGARHEFSYDPAGKLPLTGTSKAAVDPNAPLVVASSHRLTRIDERGTDGVLTGRFVTFAYNPTTGRLSSVTANDGRTVSYQHDTTAGLTKGNLTQVTGLDGLVQTYGYTDTRDVHNLTSITEATGRTPIVNTYDDQDRVIRQDEGTRRIEFNYQTPLVKTIVTRTIRDQNGLNPYTAVDTYDFEASGRITKRTDPLGHETRYTYNAAKSLIRKELWQKNGTTLSLLQATDYTYDTVGHKLTESVTLDSGEVITRSWTYDHDWIASDQVVSTAAPSKLFRTEYTFFYNSEGRPTAIQSMKRRRDDGSFQTTSFTYDARNRRLTTTHPDGVQMVNEYTGEFVTKTYFQVSGVEIPQMTRRFEYDAEGNLFRQWDARNNLTESGYDDSGRLISTTNPLGEQALKTYANDLLTETEVGRTTADGEGQVMRYVYDARGRLTGIQRKNDAGVFVTFVTYELDSEGQKLADIDALGRATRYAYDVAGRKISQTDALNKVTQYGYDAAGNQTLVIDPLSHRVNYEYDDLNRQTAIVELGVTPNPRTAYTYDAAGNLISVTDPENRTTSYQFDALSRTTRVTQPLGQFVDQTYDDRNRLQQVVTARGQKIAYTYETWGPIKDEKQYPTTSASTPDRTLTYVYDNEGNLLTLSDDDVQVAPLYSITYDAANRPYDETIQYVPGGNRILRHRYDRFGNRNGLTLQDAATASLTYSYNKLNQLSSASLAGGAVGLTYFANDDVQNVTVPGGVTRAYTYETNGPTDTINVNGPSGSLAQMTYAYDDAQNVDSITDAAGLHDYGYDGLDRLVSTTRPTGLGVPNESYTYDRVGNREDPGNSALYAYDGNNRITAGPGLTYTFDADGNLTSRSDGATLSYDPRSRLVGYAKGATSATYLHDPIGRRIRKDVNGVTTWFVWDDTRLVAEYSSAGSRTKRYAYLGSDSTPVQVEDANGTYYVHSDHQGTPRLMTNASGAMVWQAQLEAFGKAVVNEDPDGNSVAVSLNVRFPGQYADAESGLHYNYLRDYDPAVGRYVEADPIGLNGGNNLYAYVENAPLSMVDPLGLAGTCFDFTIKRVESFKYEIVSKSGSCPPNLAVKAFFKPKEQLPDQRIAQDCTSGTCVNKKNSTELNWTEQEFEFDLCWNLGGDIGINVECGKKQKKCHVKFKVTAKGSIDGWIGECEECKQ